jgi:two-component system chemotaxis sensor kinase CheA
MTLDLAQFNQAFFEESFEAIDSMEAALLSLGKGVPEPDNIDAIFRVAHSIKGGAGMFGFKEIASFTHTLETLLDALRGGRMAVDASVTNNLLKSVDVLRAMLTAVQRGEPLDAQQVADLQFDIEVIIARRPAAATATNASQELPLAPAAAPAEEAPAASWKIEFAPDRELMLRGSEPVLLMEQLAGLGDLRVEVDMSALPAFTELDAEQCLLRWRIRLSTHAPREQIAAVFEWACGEGEVSVEPAVRAAAEVSAPRENAPQPDSIPEERGAEAARGPGPLTGKSGSADGNSIRVAASKIDALINTVGEIVITQAMLAELGMRVSGPVAEELRTGLEQLERSVRELHESVMRVRMLPISHAFSRFPRLVRDLSQRLGKQIELKLNGETTELDKTVLERIGDPLVHLVRNCIDHGIEMPADRVATGKSESGTVHLEAFHRGSAIVIDVSDDGRGLDEQRILAKARERGLVAPNETPGADEIANLIFLPGFSTAEQTTDLSGRGVGMDVVRRNIKELGGTIEVRSTRGAGTRFTIRLPLTLAIVDGQTVAVGNEIYIVSLVTIIESMQLRAGAINRLAGVGEVFWFRDDYVPIVRLHEVFGVEPRYRNVSEGLVVVAEGDGRRIGLFVDDLLGQQQVVIKSLESNYGNVEGVSGATILGDGSVALILDLPGLIRTTAARAAA